MTVIDQTEFLRARVRRLEKDVEAANRLVDSVRLTAAARQVELDRARAELDSRQRLTEASVK